jgi:hypothetical protein
VAAWTLEAGDWRLVGGEARSGSEPLCERERG